MYKIYILFYSFLAMNFGLAASLPAYSNSDFYIRLDPDDRYIKPDSLAAQHLERARKIEEGRKSDPASLIAMLHGFVEITDLKKQQ